MLSLHETFENVIAQIGRKPGSVVGDSQMGLLFARTQPDVDSAPIGQVRKLIFEKVADYPLYQGKISIDKYLLLQAVDHCVIVCGESGLIQIELLANQR